MSALASERERRWRFGTVHETRCGRRAHGPRGIRNVRGSWMCTTRVTFTRRCGEARIEARLQQPPRGEPSDRCQVSARRTDVAGRVREPQSCPLVARSLKPAAHSTMVCATTTPMSDGMLVARCPGGARRSASMGWTHGGCGANRHGRDDLKLRSSAPLVKRERGV